MFWLINQFFYLLKKSELPVLRKSLSVFDKAKIGLFDLAFYAKNTFIKHGKSEKRIGLCR
jgi:hypothetical protein